MRSKCVFAPTPPPRIQRSSIVKFKQSWTPLHGKERFQSIVHYCNRNDGLTSVCTEKTWHFKERIREKERSEQWLGRVWEVKNDVVGQYKYD